MFDKKRFNEIKAKCLAESELFLTRSIRESATKYKVSYEEMMHIRKEVRREVGSKRGGVQDLRDIEKEKDVRRKVDILSDANIRYPGVVSAVYEGGNLAELGRKYGLTRQRVHQFKVFINALLATKGAIFVSDLVYKSVPNAKKMSRKSTLSK